MELKASNGELLAIIHSSTDWEHGLNFLTSNDLYIQVGTWWYQKGKLLDTHIHNEYERKSSRTQEMVFVVGGAVKAKVYDEELNFVQDVILKAGDLAIFVSGGHGYEILEQDTKVIEAKNGPFLNVEKDKRRFKGN